MAKIDPTSSEAVEPTATSWLKKASLATPARVIMLHGPPKTGKSRVAATESKDLKRVEGQAKYGLQSGVVIRDQLWLAIDSGGFDGLVEEGIEIENVLDYRGAIDAIGVVKANVEIVKEARALVKAKPEIRTIVFDTLSVYDDYLVEYWGERAPKVKKDGKEVRDTQAMYGYVKEHHRKNSSGISSIGTYRTIYICHTRHKGIRQGSGEALAEAKREATDTPYTGDLQPGITGGGAECYKADGSILFAMKSTQLAGKDPKNVSYEMLAWGSGDWEAWTRIKAIPPVVPADLRFVIETYCREK